MPDTVLGTAYGNWKEIKSFPSRDLLKPCIHSSAKLLKAGGVSRSKGFGSSLCALCCR
jgi:hypothetical protein